MVILHSYVKLPEVTRPRLRGRCWGSLAPGGDVEHWGYQLSTMLSHYLEATPRMTRMTKPWFILIRNPGLTLYIHISYIIYTYIRMGGSWGFLQVFNSSLVWAGWNLGDPWNKGLGHSQNRQPSTQTELEDVFFSWEKIDVWSTKTAGCLRIFSDRNFSGATSPTCSKRYPMSAPTVPTVPTVFPAPGSTILAKDSNLGLSKAPAVWWP